MIEFDRVSCRRGAQTVVDAVTFSVAAGECVALAGRSGAGKSSVLQLINGMLRPSAGRVTVNGRDAAIWNPIELRRRTGYVIQEIGLFPHMTVRRNVGVVPHLLGWDGERIKRRTDELLDLVGLPPLIAERWPDQLSGGQRQRVGVARALAAEPPIVLMDEPFGALDPITRADLHDEVRRIRNRIATTIVLVTHDMREAMSLADRIGVLDEGRLVAIGTARELGRSEQPTVKLLLRTAGAGAFG